MKAVVIALALFAVGVAFGYFARIAFSEDRIQMNLSALSGETLAHLDVIGRFTRGFAPDEIDRRWQEHVAFTKVEGDITGLKEAWQSWDRAIIFQQVEQVGWNDYRDVMVENSARYLAFIKYHPDVFKSEFAKKEAQRAVDMIREAIPADALEKGSSRP